QCSALDLGERAVADDHPQEAEQDVAVADRQAAAAGHPELVVARDVDEGACALEPEALEPRDDARGGLPGQERGAADRIGLVGLDAVGEQPPAPVLDGDRAAYLRLEVVDDVLQVPQPAPSMTTPVTASAMPANWTALRRSSRNSTESRATIAG